MKTISNILITGGSSDIAHPLIEKILKNTQFNIIVSSFQNRKFYDTKRIIEITVDLSSETGIREFIKKISKYECTHYIQLQGYANQNDTLENINYEEMIRLLNINLLSSSLIISSLLPIMKKNSFGRIVLMGTASSNFGGGKNSFMYGMSKHSVSYVVKHLAKYYSEFGIIANGVSPGLIKTKFHTKTLKRDKDFLEKRGKSVRIGYAGKAEDVANLIYNLAFENNFICGETIKIDGADFI